ncbi:hypothetical protein N7454_010689 [Penicillium verhagenii]|nr:hypothetical protein N7454_010689 [Penicillium verhagenii]
MSPHQRPSKVRDFEDGQSNNFQDVETDMDGVGKCLQYPDPTPLASKLRLNDDVEDPLWMRSTRRPAVSRSSNFGMMGPPPTPAPKAARDPNVSVEEDVDDIPTRAEDTLKTNRNYLSPLSRSGSYTASNYTVNTDGLAIAPQAARQSMDMADSPSPVNIPPPPPKVVTWETTRLKGTWKLEKLKGPASHFPSHLLKILEHWHETNGIEPPPCFWTGKINGLRKWGNFKVFGREGDEHDMSIFKISCSTPRRTYCVVILHSENEADVFIDYSDVRTVKGNDFVRYECHFLTPWHGARYGFERQDSAIHVWSDPHRKIEFCTSWFDGRDSVAQGSRTRGKGKNPYPAVPMTPTLGEQHRSYSFNSTGSAMSASSSKKPVPDADSDEEGIVAPTRVKRALFTPTSIRFKLFSQFPPQARILAFNDCISSEEIFKRAREFYSESEMSREMGLLCKIPGEAQLRYIGAGCADEFDILCEDIRDFRCASPVSAQLR